MVMTLGDVDLQVEVTSSGTTYSMDNLLKSATIDIQRNRPERAVVRVARTDTTKTFDPMDVVQIDTRASGETTFDTRFYGFVEEVYKTSQDDVVELVCSGESKKLAHTMIAYKEYGQEFVDRGRYNILTASLQNLSVQLDVTTPVTPLEEVQVASPRHVFGELYHDPVVFGGNETLTIVQWKATGRRSVAQEIVLPRGAAGPNIEIWIKMQKFLTNLQYPTATLAVEIYAAESGTIYPEGPLTFSGEVVAVGYISPADVTSAMEFHAVTLTLFDNSTDIVAAAMGQYASSWNFFIVIRANSIHNEGQYRIRLREWQTGFSTEGVPHAAFENDDADILQTKWTYTIDGITGCLLDVFYMDDAAWIGLYPDEYAVDVSSSILYIYHRLDYGMKLPFRGKRSHVLLSKDFSQMKPFRVSYWKGAPDFSATVEDFANDWIKPYVDTVDVQLSDPPDITFQAFQFQNVSVLDALDEIIQWSTATWRIYKNQAGSKVFEVRSSRVPADFTGLPAAEQDDRSFYSGFDVATGTTGDASFVRLLGAEQRRVLGNKFGRTIVRGAMGSATVGDVDADSGFANTTRVAWGSGAASGGPDFGEAANTRGVEFIERVSARVVGVDFTNVGSYYTNCNELIYLKDTAIGIDGSAYVVAGITLAINMQAGIEFTIHAEDTVSTRFKETIVDGGFSSITDGLGALAKRSTGFAGSYTPQREGSVMTTAPLRDINTNVVDQREEIIYGEDLSLTYNPAFAAYYIGIGFGSLSGSDLADQVALVLAETVSVDSGTNTLVVAEISESEILKIGGPSVFNASNKVSELKISARTTDSAADPEVILGTYTYGPSGTVKGPQPLIARHGRIVVCFKLT